MVEAKDREIKEAVKEYYGAVARGASCCGAEASCCGQTDTRMETVPLYSKGEVQGLPTEAVTASAGCGNPTALASLKPGETVLDLGSGGGIDCFLARKQVGPEGRVIGLDMTDDMLQLAGRNVAKLGYTNVEFRKGEMEEMPVEDGSVDVIISNCVINLSPDKDAVFREAYRVLRPGGRLHVSDLVLTGPLPKEVRESVEQWAGCIAGALIKEDYLQRIEAAGFSPPEVVEQTAYSHDGTDNVLSIMLSAVKS